MVAQGGSVPGQLQVAGAAGTQGSHHMVICAPPEAWNQAAVVGVLTNTG